MKNKIVFLDEIFNFELLIGVTQNYQRWFSLSFFIQKNCKILGNKKFKKVNKEEMFVCQKSCGNVKVANLIYCDRAKSFSYEFEDFESFGYKI